MGQNIQNLSSLFSGYRTIAQRVRAPKFNVFRVLNKIIWWENITHTPLLAELLNPEGTHGLGNLFLESFLHLPQLGLDTAHFSEVGWTVVAQKAAKTGIPDLTIKNYSTKHHIMIENKVLSDNHPGQLEGYLHSLNSDAHFTESDRRRLIYLTPDGRKPRNFPVIDPCFKCMSYKYDIMDWLQTLLPKISIPGVRECLFQYIQIIPEMEKGCAPMAGLDKAVLDYLVDPANLEIAFEITEAFSQVKESIATDCWRNISTDLQSSLSKDDDGKNWVASEPPGGKDALKDSGCLLIKQRNLASSSNAPVLAFVICGGRYTLSIGLDLMNESNLPVPLPAILRDTLNDLRIRLQSDGFSQMAGQTLARKQAGSWNFNDKQALLAVAQGKSAKETLEKFWEFFRGYSKTISEINQILHIHVSK